MLLPNRICTIIVISIFVQYAAAQSLGFRSFKSQKDNQPFKINTLFKNNEGYIYAGTTDGLYSFDGIKFKRINFEISAVKDTVTAIFSDKENRMWVGFKNGHIAKKTGSILKYFEPEEGTPKSSITSFLQDKQNNIWFSTNGEGIYYFTSGHLYLIDTADGLSDTHIHALALADNGDVLAATDQGINICSISGSKKRVTVIGPKNGLPDYYVTSIIPAGNDKFWIGLQEKGFCLYDHAAGRITVPPAANNWGHGQINALLVSQNNLWIATEENGLLKQHGADQPVTAVNIGTDLKGKINNLLQDNEGNIWMTTSNELISTAGERLTLLPLYDKAIFETIHSILSDHQDNIWISTNGGLIRYTLVNGSYTPKKYPIAGLNSKTDITALYQDPFQNIWIGTMGSGIFLLDPKTGRNRILEENPILKNASILSVTGTGNTVCAGGLEGVAMIFELNGSNATLAGRYEYTNYNNIVNIGNNYIYNVFKDSRGKIWFGTDGKGITVLEKGKFTHYGKENGLLDDHIYSFTEDIKGNIWFNTEKAGIYSFDGKVFRNYAAANGISSLKITTIKTDRSGKVIIIQEKGIDILDPLTGRVSYLNNAQGITDLNTDIASVTQDNEGNVLFSTANGIVIYRPVANTTDQPKTIIENVQLLLSDVDKDSPGNFKYDENSLTCNFTGLYYTNPDEIRYQYKLDGLDTAWISTLDRNISFPKLQPGTYKFHVRSSLSENFESAHEATYAFVIETPIWKRSWFIILCILAIGLLIWLYMKAREAQLHKLQLLQQEKIQFQFQVLRNQINPHFLFNSFNTLISTIEENPKMAVDYVENLSEFFRNIVNYRDKDVISLEEEISLMKTYFYLQQKRYGDHLKLIINVSEETKKHTFIPPLTLQLLLENAIKHNAVSKETQLTVELYAEDGKWLVLRNNINPKLSKEAGSGMGLQNIINRYNLLSGEPVKLNNNGIHFTVSLPILKQQ